MDRHLLRLAGGLELEESFTPTHLSLSRTLHAKGFEVAGLSMSSMLHLFSGSADALASTVWGRGRATAD